MTADLSIARCMDLVTAADVIRAVELYHDGGALHYLPAGIRRSA